MIEEGSEDKGVGVRVEVVIDRVGKKALEIGGSLDLLALSSSDQKNGDLGRSLNALSVIISTK